MPFPDTLTGWRNVAPPPQASRVYFSYRIMVPGASNAGYAIAGEHSWSVVGTFQNFAPSSTRQVVRVRGIANNGGYPLELVPGPADTSISVSYLSLYLLPLNEALGYSIGSVIDLNRQRIPFDIQEVCVFPSMTEVASHASGNEFPGEGTVEVNHYRECFLSDIGRTINQGTVTIAETATIQVTAIAATARQPGGTFDPVEALSYSTVPGASIT